MKNLERKIASLDSRELRGLILPRAPRPLANYVPAIQTGQLLMISGQGPVAADGTAIIGLLGGADEGNLTLEQGQHGARLAALNILAQAGQACDGDFNKIKRLVKLGGFVACTQDFTDIPAVINGASDLMVALLGEDGKHTRFAVGVASLPLGWAVEIEAIFELHKSA